MQVQWFIILKIEYLFHAYFLKFFFLSASLVFESIVSSRHSALYWRMKLLCGCLVTGWQPLCLKSSMTATLRVDWLWPRWQPTSGKAALLKIGRCVLVFIWFYHIWYSLPYLFCTYGFYSQLAVCVIKFDAGASWRFLSVFLCLSGLLGEERWQIGVHK